MFKKWSLACKWFVHSSERIVGQNSLNESFLENFLKCVFPEKQMQPLENCSSYHYLKSLALKSSCPASAVKLVGRLICCINKQLHCSLREKKNPRGFLSWACCYRYRWEDKKMNQEVKVYQTPRHHRTKNTSLRRFLRELCVSLSTSIVNSKISTRLLCVHVKVFCLVHVLAWTWLGSSLYCSSSLWNKWGSLASFPGWAGWLPAGSTHMNAMKY